MERALEVYAVIHLGLMGLSHVIHHRAWAEFFVWLAKLGRSGAFAHGFLSLGFGSLILAFHWVWSGMHTVLTVVGVFYMVKAVQCFLLPDFSLRSLQRVSLDRSRVFIVPGVVFLLLAIAIAYGLTVPLAVPTPAAR